MGYIVGHHGIKEFVQQPILNLFEFITRFLMTQFPVAFGYLVNVVGRGNTVNQSIQCFFRASRVFFYFTI